MFNALEKKNPKHKHSLKPSKPEDFCFVGISTVGMLWKFPAEEFVKFAAEREGYRAWTRNKAASGCSFTIVLTTTAASPLPHL